MVIFEGFGATKFVEGLVDEIFQVVIKVGV